MQRIAGIVTALALVSVSACSKSSSSGSSETPKAPTNLTAVPQTGGAHLTWQDNSDNESQFMIDRKDPGADWKTVGMVPFNTTLYHDIGVSAGMTYSYRVMAMPKSGDNGSYSNEVTFIAPAASSTAGTGATGTSGAGAAGTDSGHDAHHPGTSGAGGA